MAEVIRNLADNEVSGHVPMDELLDYQQREVEFATANHLDGIYREFGALPFEGNYLVQVNEEIKVAFCISVPHGIEAD